MVIQKFNRQRVENVRKQNFFESMGNRLVFESALERGGTVSVSDHIITTQNYSEFEYVEA